MRIIILGIVILSSLTAYASDCSLKGIKSTPGFIYLPWMHEKENFQVDSFEKCLDAARELLNTANEITFCDGQISGPCENRTVTEKISKVKFKYLNAEEEISGVIKH